MLDAAAKALAQMFTPPFRTVLLKSVGLALALLAVLAIALYRLLEWLSSVRTLPFGHLRFRAHSDGARRRTVGPAAGSVAYFTLALCETTATHWPLRFS